MLEKRRRAQLKLELQNRIESEFSHILWKDIIEQKNVDSLVQEIWARKIDPQNAAHKILGELIEELKGRQ